MKNTMVNFLTFFITFLIPVLYIGMLVFASTFINSDSTFVKLIITFIGLMIMKGGGIGFLVYMIILAFFEFIEWNHLYTLIIFGIALDVIFYGLSFLIQFLARRS